MFPFWYLVCLLFFLININILIDESHDTIYKIVDQNQPIQYLYCFNLNEIIINKTKINTNEIRNDFNYYLWIQINKEGKYGSIIRNETIDEVINQTKSRDYLIYKNRICFIFNQTDFRSFNELSFNLPISHNYFIFNNKTFSFLELEDAFSSFNQLSIQHKEYPYSGCSKNYSNFKCLNDKIKRIQPLSRYYYRSDDNESIELNYQINQTIINNEINIIKQCYQIDCNISLLNPTSSEYDKSESIILKSFLITPELDFYLQLVGLIVFFLNIPIYSLIIIIINSINLRQLKIKFVKSKKLKKILSESSSKLRLDRFKLLTRYSTINNLIILILLICLTVFSSRSIFNFIEERDYPSTKSISINPITSELSIVICVKISDIKGEDYNINNRSLSELEKESDNFLNIVLNDIYLEFLNKKIPTKWQLKSKLIRFKLFHHEYLYLSRCFQLRIFLNQPKYQKVFSATKLIIEFNKYYDPIIFILIDNEVFNSNSYDHSSYYNFRKRILERSKLNQIKKCKDYNQIDDNCESKSNCIDQCTTKRIYNQIKNLTHDNLLIDKNYFTDQQWSNLFIKPYFDDKIYRNISKECKDKYSELDLCVDIKLKRHYITNYKDNNKKEIDFNYDVIYHREDEPSIFKLLLDLLNIQGNLFGLNFLSFSLMILELFRFINLKLIKIIKLFIYLICLICFIFHLWSIYDEIINIEIIFSEHYELINTIQTPDLIFCFNFNHTKLINQNYKLTYQYLDKITFDQLREDLIFNRIEYLNQSNKWTKLDKRTNFQDDNLEIRIFYYLDMKCFKIIQKNIEYNRNQFQFNDKIRNDGLVFKILLNRRYLYETIFYFFTKSKNKIQFSKIEEINLDYRTFKIKHELIVRDEFELIKNPLSFLSDENDQNDLDYFFNKLINYFDIKLNLVTFKLPINKTELNLHKELDDNLFIQLYNQKQDQINANHLRKHSHNYLEIVTHSPEDFFSNLITDFEFSLSFYGKVIVVSNKISLIKLIINLLNVLSFWFDLGILDLHYYFFIFKLLPLQLYKLLIIIKNQLKSFI